MSRTPILSAVALFALLVAAPSARAGQFEDRSLQGRRYLVYVPSTYQPGQPAPLLVLLHGCTQDPEIFARSTKAADAAERRGWLVLLPQQPSSSNQNKCWNWFETAHQGRDAGEPRWIAGCVEAATREWSVDRDRVYCAGLSAGAAMSVIMGVTYPDMFAAVGVGAGLEYQAATGLVDAFSAMSRGGPSPDQQARRARDVMGPRARAVPAIVIHGSADSTVAPVNGQQVASMWASLAGLIDPTQVPTAGAAAQQVAPGGLRYEQQDWSDGAGRVWVRRVLVQGMSHAWSGGARDGTYVDPSGPDATELCLDFFAACTRSGPSAATPVPPPPPTPPHAPTPPPAPTPTPITPAPVPPVTLTQTIELPSRAAEQGSVGRFLAHGARAGAPVLGDDGMFDADRYRALLSFDTRSIPVGGRVEGVVLRIKRASLEGAIDSVSVDLRRGAFGKTAQPEIGDHGAAATLTDLASFAAPGSDDWIEIDLGRNAVQALERQGVTQLRLRAIGPASFRPNRLTLAEAKLVVSYVP